MDKETKCLHCMTEFGEEDTNLCNHHHPTVVCPYCLLCSCSINNSRHNYNVTNKVGSDTLMEPSPAEGKMRLGELLIKAGKISAQQLWDALIEQERSHLKLGNILVFMKMITAGDLQPVLADQIAIDEIDLEQIVIDFRIVQELGIDFCINNKIIPIDKYQIGNKETLRCVMPTKVDVINVSEKLTNFIVIPYLTNKKDFNYFMKKIKEYRPDDEDVFWLE